MASPSTVVTLGFGSFGAVGLLPTLGFGTPPPETHGRTRTATAAVSTRGATAARPGRAASAGRPDRTADASE